MGTALEEVQIKNPDPETLLAADQGHQEKQYKPIRCMLNFTKHARAKAEEIYL